MIRRFLFGAWLFGTFGDLRSLFKSDPKASRIYIKISEYTHSLSTDTWCILESPGIGEGSNLSQKKEKEPRKRRLLDGGNLLCGWRNNLSFRRFIVTYGNHERRRVWVWMRFDDTYRTLRKDLPSYDTAREQQESGNTAKERSTVVFVSLCPRIPVLPTYARAVYCEMSLALNGGGVTDFAILIEF